MHRLFRLKNEKNWKSLLLSADRILLANTVYKTEEEFVEKYEQKGFLKSRLAIDIIDVTELRHPEKESDTARVTYNKNGKAVHLDLIFFNVEEKNSFIGTIARQKKLIATTTQVSVMKAIGPSLIGLAFTVLFTFIIYLDAEVIESGGEVDTSGRRSLYKQLFAWLGEKLGTQGTLIAGCAFALLCFYFIYKNLQSRPMEVVYS
jgi:hypothetical protein